MVKLKVTARVIPEDAYLESIEASVSQQNRTRGEKRFILVVRDTEDWYIGTLALEIKKRYLSLYKHDLGQIKYLKDSEDDCDLDPELSVADALVNEGKALSDPSDQHVTIKVIQEQGQAVRQGSVIPDLSQVHYRLPERSTRPPVPRFEDLAATLGKRKAEDVIPETDAGQKRTRLDEIEEGDQVIASIERDQPFHSDVIIQDSQSTRTSPFKTRRVHAGASHSPDMTWSFSQIGPPTTTQESSRTQQFDDGDTRIEVQPHGGKATTSTPSLKRTPSEGLHRLTTPKHNANLMSPSATATSTSKRFLKPRRELDADPDSDIDDSQMSPASRDTSRITPRLVPSTRANTRHALDKEAVSREVSTFSEKNTEEAKIQTVSPQDEARAVLDDKIDDANNDQATGSNETKPNSRLVENETDDKHVTDSDEVSSSADSSTSDSDSHTKEDEVALDRALENDEAEEQPQPEQKPSQRNTSPQHDKSPVQSVKSDIKQTSVPKTSQPSPQKQTLSHAGTGDLSIVNKKSDGDAATTPSESHSNNGSLRARRARKRPTIPEQDRAVSGPGTPPLDSPSEQLSLALQESTHSSRNTKPVELETSKLAFTDAVAESKRSLKEWKERGSHPITNGTNAIDTTKEQPPRTRPVRKSAATSGSSTATASSDDSTASQQNSQPVEQTSAAAPELDKPAKNSLVPPSGSQATREASTDSHVTNVSKRVLPAGMTEEEYLRLVKGNAHLTAHGPKPDARRKSTPAVARKSTSDTPTSKTQKQRTPVPSTASKAATSKAGNTAAKPHVSDADKPVPAPSVSSVANSSMTEATPTPKPRAKPRAKPLAAASTAVSAPTTVKPPNSVTKSVSKPASKPATRPNLAPNFSSARSLAELRVMINSANNSTPGSPAPSVSRFAAPKKSILDDDDDDDESDESSSSSESDAQPPKASQQAKPAVTSSAMKKAPVKGYRPDPTIRDVSTDEGSDASDHE